MTDPIAAVGILLVASISSPFLAQVTQPVFNLSSGRGQKGADDPAPFGGDCRQPLQTGPPDQMKEKGLRRVI